MTGEETLEFLRSRSPQQLLGELNGLAAGAQDFAGADGCWWSGTRRVT